jgi:Holliday junction resolvase
MNAKGKGTRNEHRTIRYLEAIGYRCTRAAASMGEWDVIAISSTDVRLVQCKSNRWPGSIEVEAMEQFPCPAGVRREIWRWDDRVREPKVKVIG